MSCLGCYFHLCDFFSFILEGSNFSLCVMFFSLQIASIGTHCKLPNNKNHSRITRVKKNWIQTNQQESQKHPGQLIKHQYGKHRLWNNYCKSTNAKNFIHFLLYTCVSHKLQSCDFIILWVCSNTTCCRWSSSTFINKILEVARSFMLWGESC